MPSEDPAGEPRHHVRPVYMECVEIVAAVAGVVVVVGVIALLGATVHRRRVDELHSVEGYRRRLDTLQHMRNRPAVRPGPPPDEGGEPHVRTLPPPPPSARARERSLAAMNYRPRRVGGPIAAVVIVLAAVGALVYVGLQHRHHTTPTSSRTTTSSPGHHHSHGHSTSTTTTLPKRYVAVSSSVTSATYAPASASYVLSVGATTGQCWVGVTASNGTTVLSQTLTPGTVKSLTMTGRSTIVIGAPSVVTISIDHVTVVLPAGAQAPFTVTVVPA
jgi:hypothetical protein